MKLGGKKMEAFEGIVKKHVINGADIHTAFGRAIGDDPDAYGRYLKSGVDDIKAAQTEQSDQARDKR